MSVGDLVWLRPFWLVLVPLAVLAGLWGVRRSGSLGDWERVLDDEVRAGLARLGRIREGSGARNWWPLAGVALVAVALSGPARPDADTRALRDLDGIVLVVDLSSELASTPHLDSAVTAARLLTLTAGSRPVGLVVYDDEAFLASAMTSDAAALGETLQFLDAETLAGDGESCAACGLALARQLLAAADIRFGDIVLLTGEDALPDAAQGEATRILQGGTGLAILSPASSAAHAALLSEQGGMAGTFGTPEALARHLERRRGVRMAKAGFAVLLYRDYGRYLLFLALFPALVLLWRRA